MHELAQPVVGVHRFADVGIDRTCDTTEGVVLTHPHVSRVIYQSREEPERSIFVLRSDAMPVFQLRFQHGLHLSAPIALYFAGPSARIDRRRSRSRVCEPNERSIRTRNPVRTSGTGAPVRADR